MTARPFDRDAAAARLSGEFAGEIIDRQRATGRRHGDVNLARHPELKAMRCHLVVAARGEIATESNASRGTRQLDACVPPIAAAQPGRRKRLLEKRRVDHQDMQRERQTHRSPQPTIRQEATERAPRVGT